MQMGAIGSMPVVLATWEVEVSPEFKTQSHQKKKKIVRMYLFSYQGDIIWIQCVTQYILVKLIQRIM
jgi:hypothetical protein